MQFVVVVVLCLSLQVLMYSRLDSLSAGILFLDCLVASRLRQIMSCGDETVRQGAERDFNDLKDRGAIIAGKCRLG